MTEKEMIQSACEDEMVSVKGWETNEDGLRATLGRFSVLTNDYEDEGLFEGDEGVLTAEVVGAEKYANQRVSFGLTPEGCDAPVEVRDLGILEPLD